jgi:surface antigen
MAIKAEYEKRKEDLKKRYVQVQPVQRNIPTVGARVVGYDPYIEFKGDHLWYAGNCTRYVASEYDIPWTGNAATWDDQAAQHGYEVDATPREGDIYQSNEGPYGHVAIVRNVDGDTITIEEMNYQGYGVISERTVEVTDDMQFIKMQ